MTRAEILNCLTDRPCDVYRFHESGRCERWDCVFEEKPDDCEDAISRAEAIEAIAKADCTDGTKAIFCGRYIVELLKSLPSVRSKMCFEGMTNGEVIDSLFQNTDMYHTYHNQNFMLRELVFTDEWWDAPYKAGRK